MSDNISPDDCVERPNGNTWPHKSDGNVFEKANEKYRHGFRTYADYIVRDYPPGAHCSGEFLRLDEKVEGA